MTKKSKYYYDYTRNMSAEQVKNSCCGKPSCDGKCKKKNVGNKKIRNFHL